MPAAAQVAARRPASSDGWRHGGPPSGPWMFTGPPCTAVANTDKSSYHRGMDDGRVLFREFLRAPTQVATLTASSDALVAAMIAPLPLHGESVVMELGAGTGRVADALQRRLGGRGRHIAVEINPLLAERLAVRHPNVTVVCSDAGRLPALLREHDIECVDAVVALLPWSAYASAPLPALVAHALAPTGVFTQVSLWLLHLLPPARRLVRDMRAAFSDVTVDGPVWGNLPPARVLVARSPGAHLARR